MITNLKYRTPTTCEPVDARAPSQYTAWYSKLRERLYSCKNCKVEKIQSTFLRRSPCRQTWPAMHRANTCIQADAPRAKLRRTHPTAVPLQSLYTLPCRHAPHAHSRVPTRRYNILAIRAKLRRLHIEMPPQQPPTLP